MRLHRRNVLRLRQLLVICLAGCVVALGYSYTLSLIIEYPYVLKEVRLALLSGLSVAGLSGFAELFWFRAPAGAWLRRRPMWLSLLVRVLVHTALLMAALSLNRELHAYLEGSAELAAWPVNSLIRDLIFCFVMMSVFFFMLQVTSLIGGRTLMNLMLGRYHRPMKEERIFLFVDLKGSSALARDLGDAGFHEFLSRFFFDCDDILVNAGGEIYSYVGDAAIVVWPLDTPERNARPVQAIFELEAQMARLAQGYVARFGQAPQFRCALHGGSVVTGECGDSRQQITFLGDAVNITARLEQVAKTSGMDFVISGKLLDRTDLPLSVEVVDAGVHTFKGVDEPMRVHGLRAAPGMVAAEAAE